MNLFELSAKITADTSGFDKSLGQTKKSMDEYKKDVTVLAQTYKKQGMDMSAAMKRAYAEIDKSQYETSENSKEDSKEFAKNWENAGGKVGSVAKKMGTGFATMAKIGIAALGAAATGIIALTTQASKGYAEYEQLAGGAQKIFDQMDYSRIASDAQNAYKELGLSANQYLAIINDVGATFAATMGDEAGYEAAKIGLKAISDYASGTGKNVDELSQKFTLITRSTSSYQSIADQFSGILPATSAAFLEQAQAAGILSNNYKKLTDVPIDEYQAAVAQMLEQGVKELGLYNNTVNEAFSTLSGSLAMAKGAWSNLVTGLADDSADFGLLIGNFVESVSAVATNLVPRIGTALSGIGQLVENLAPVLANSLPDMVESLLPPLLNAAVNLVSSLASALPNLLESMLPVAIDAAMSVIMSLLNVISGNISKFLQIGIDAIVQIVSGISEALPQIIESAVTIITELINTLTSPENLSLLLDTAMVLIENIVVGLIDNLPALVEAAIQLVQNLVDFVTEPGNLEKLINMAVNMVTTIMDGLVGAIPLLVNAAVKLIVQLVKFLLEPENITMLINASLSIVLAISQGLAEAAIEMAKGALVLIEELIKTFKETDWKQVATDIIEKLLDGLKNAWVNVKAWFNDVWDSLFGDRTVDVDVNTGDEVKAPNPKANGLSYVPYDGYYALLHKGERVLTATENRAYNNGNGGTGGIVINQYIQSVPQTPADLASATEAYFEQARWML